MGCNVNLFYPFDVLSKHSLADCTVIDISAHGKKKITKYLKNCRIYHLEAPLSLTGVDCHIWNCLRLHRIPAEVLLPLNKMYQSEYSVMTCLSVCMIIFATLVHYHSMGGLLASQP